MKENVKKKVCMYTHTHTHTHIYKCVYILFSIEKSADSLVAIWYIKNTILKRKSNLQNSVQYGST